MFGPLIYLRVMKRSGAPPMVPVAIVLSHSLVAEVAGVAQPITSDLKVKSHPIIRWLYGLLSAQASIWVRAT